MEDFELYDRKMEQKLAMLPKCKCCHEPIQDDVWHNIPNYGYICDKCLDECEEWAD